MKLHILSKTSRCILFLVAFIFSGHLYGQTFVDVNAGGANDGTSWANAYVDLNVALNNTAGGEIWVAEGTYLPTVCNPCDMADRDIAFDIPPAVQLYGGFAGNENSLDQRDWVANQTILSGDIGTSIDSTDNSFRVLTARNSLVTTVLDGFIIEEGNADGSFGFSSGGGLLIDANTNGTGNIQIRNCTFRNNYAGGGGGIAIDCVLGGVCQALIRDCLFEGNTASLEVVSSGAAIFMQGNSGAQVEPRIINCTFRENFCGNDGGAISMTPTGAGSFLGTLVDSCHFLNNQATDRGAAIWYRMSSFGNTAVMIRNSRFIQNISGGQGAAIYARSSFDNIANDTIMNCLFSQNSADGSSTINEGEGGAIFLRGSQDGTRNHHIVNCVFDRNSAENRGGAVATSSVVSSAGTCNADIVNCTFSGNITQGDGGAIHTEGSDGVHTMVIANSIFWQDVATGNGPEIFNNNASIALEYSNIEGGIPSNVTDGGNNLELDPQFGDPASGDLHLLSCSPLLNVGDNDALPPIAVLDLDGFPRIHEGIVDLGAYETGIIYVDHTASTGANDGRSWEDAFIDLQDALAIASAGRQIWVAQGTYLPASCSPCEDMDREIPFSIPSNVELYGGFNGTETQLDQRDWVGNPTILSGDIGMPGDSTDNSINVLVAQNVSDKTILDGFTIEEGNADGSFGASAGGGLLIDARSNGTGDIQIRNCTFQHNYAGGGGAIAIDCVLGGVCRALIRDCQFKSNTASLQVVSSGAGIFMQGNSGAQVKPQIINCNFQDNFCGNDGGAISMTPTGEGSFLGTLIDSCEFLNNRSTDRGAAIWYRMSNFGNTQVVIRNSRFIGNIGGGQGAAIYARSSFDNVANDTIINCLFALNSTNGTSTVNDGEGGAVFLRGSQDGTRNHQIINCVFDRNIAQHRGGAIGTSSFVSSAGTCNAEVINCTFYGNTTQGEGGAIHAEGSDGTNIMNLTNNIFWNDNAVLAGAEFFNNGASMTVSYSDVEGGLPDDITDGGNNLDVDPQFLDPDTGNLRISPCSPARNAGLNTAIPPDLGDLNNDGDLSEPIPYDLDYGTRIFDEIVDMGAYEWNGEPPALAITFDTTHISCAGICDGEATVEVAGGTPGYSFLWSNAQETETITDLCPGIYQITITDSFNCEIVDSIEIFDSEVEGLEPMISGGVSLCSDSMAVLETGTFDAYEWSTNETTQQITIAAGGEYSVTVTDENGCTGSDTLTVEEVPNPEVQIIGEPTFCVGDSTTLDAGVFNTYLWTTGDTTQQVNIMQPGEYSVTVTNNNNCEGSGTVPVEVLPNPEAEISGSSTFCSGSATVLDGGTGFAEYLWSDGSMEQTLSVENEGTYGLTVTDTNGCVDSTTIMVSESAELAPVISGALSICADSMTILDAGVFATYEWTTGDTTQQITVSEAGTYGVTVSDGSGCSGMTEVAVEILPAPEVEITGSTTFCPGSSTVLDGGAGYSDYQWSDGSMEQTLEVTTEGLYMLTVTDANGCKSTTEVVVVENAELSPVISGALSICADSMTILDAGVFATYEWTTGDTTQQITVSEAGTYGVTVSDGSGCSGTTEVAVEILPSPEVEITGSTTFCPGSSTVLDGGAGYSDYQWSDGSMEQTLEVTAEGLYMLTVTDANGCKSTTEVMVVENAELSPVISGALSICSDSMTILDAGVFATYEWTTGDTTQQITVSEAGTYGVTVSDGSGCSGMTEVAVEILPSPEVEITGSTTFCPGSSTVLDGGAGYSDYQWSDGSMEQTLEVTTEGLYMLTVTDANGCKSTTEVMVVENAELSPVISGALSICSDSMTILDAGVFATYEWTTGDTTQQITVSEAGTYGVTVSDGAGCFGSSQVTVTAIQELTAIDDAFIISNGEERSVVYDLAQNDELNGLTDWNINILTSPDFGQIDNLQNGLLAYSAPENGAGVATIIYELCHPDCPGSCSEALVTIEVQAEETTIPNGITPNGDGLNDTFVFEQLNANNPDEFPDNELIIYNRWGDIVYRKKPYDNSWEGTNQNGQPLPEATYYYILYLDIGESIILRGDVTVLRGN